LSVALTTSAMVIAGSIAYRAFAVASPKRATSQPTFINEWTSVLPQGIRVGDSSAAVTILEFADLECPACRAYHSTLTQLLEEYRRDVAVVYVSFPLTIHRFADGAARAADCAARVGRFREWIEVVYRKQDSLGLKSWGAFAQEAGIQDTAAIQRCAVDRRPVARIASGVAFGREIGVTGTPTVLINGWRYYGAPTKEELTKAVERLLKGKKPFGKAD